MLDVATKTKNLRKDIPLPKETALHVHLGICFFSSFLSRVPVISEQHYNADISNTHSVIYAACLEE